MEFLLLPERGYKMEYDLNLDDFDSVEYSEYFEEYYTADWDEDPES
jgi:hypothetical protein